MSRSKSKLQNAGPETAGQDSTSPMNIAMNDDDDAGEIRDSTSSTSAVDPYNLPDEVWNTGNTASLGIQSQGNLTNEEYCTKVLRYARTFMETCNVDQKIDTKPLVTLLGTWSQNRTITKEVLNAVAQVTSPENCLIWKKDVRKLVKQKLVPELLSLATTWKGDSGIIRLVLGILWNLTVDDDVAQHISKKKDLAVMVEAVLGRFCDGNRAEDAEIHKITCGLVANLLPHTREKSTLKTAPVIQRHGLWGMV